MQIDSGIRYTIVQVSIATIYNLLECQITQVLNKKRKKCFSLCNTRFLLKMPDVIFAVVLITTIIFILLSYVLDYLLPRKYFDWIYGKTNYVENLIQSNFIQKKVKEFWIIRRITLYLMSISLMIHPKIKVLFFIVTTTCLPYYAIFLMLRMFAKEIKEIPYIKYIFHYLTPTVFVIVLSIFMIATVLIGMLIIPFLMKIYLHRISFLITGSINPHAWYIFCIIIIINILSIGLYVLLQLENSSTISSTTCNTLSCTSQQLVMASLIISMCSGVAYYFVM